MRRAAVSSRGAARRGAAGIVAAGIVAAGVVAFVALGVGVTAMLAPIPLPAGPTDAEKDVAVARELDELWVGLGLEGLVERPVVESLPAIDFEQATADRMECFSAEGVLTDGTVLISGGVDTVPLANVPLAIYRCSARHPYDPEANGFMSREQREYYHRYVATWLSPCLGHALGRTMPDVPALGEFLQRGAGAWSPYTSTMDLSEDEAERVMALCEPMPPGLFGR